MNDRHDVRCMELYFMNKDIWQRSFKFGVRVVKMCEQLPNSRVAWEIEKQIIRSSLSIAGNIAEGSGGSSKKEFTRYIDIARKSALETYNWLLFIEEIFFLHNRMLFIKKECVEIIKILNTIVLNSKL